MRRYLKWTVILPLLQVALTLTLLRIGNIQERAILSEAVAVLDYEPPARQIALALNLPAAVVATPVCVLAGRHLIHQTVLWLSIAGLWAWIGHTLDRRRDPNQQKMNPSSFARWLRIVIAILGAVGAGLLFFRLLGPVSLLVPVAGAAWSFYFAWNIVATLSRRRAAARIQPS